MDALFNYARDEIKDKLGQDEEMGHWRKRFCSDVPRQHNGYDCGVFALMFAEHHGRDALLSFHQKHMDYFRAKVVADIMQQHID